MDEGSNVLKLFTRPSGRHPDFLWIQLSYRSHTFSPDRPTKPQEHTTKGVLRRAKKPDEKRKQTEQR